MVPSIWKPEGVDARCVHLVGLTDLPCTAGARARRIHWSVRCEKWTSGPSAGGVRGAWCVAVAVAVASLLGACGGGSGGSTGARPDEGSTPGKSTCGSGQTMCGADGGADGGAAFCANLQTDNANCGACGTKCSAPSYCASGSCCTTKPWYLDADGDGFGNPTA